MLRSDLRIERFPRSSSLRIELEVQKISVAAEKTRYEQERLLKDLFAQNQLAHDQSMYRVLSKLELLRQRQDGMEGVPNELCETHTRPMENLL